MAKSKLIVITGATSGIGAEIVREFCKPGLRLFLVGRNERKLGALLKKLPPRQVAGTALADLTSVSAIHDLLGVLGKLSRVDVLVHNAGAHSQTELGSLETDALDSLFAVNVRAPFLLTQGLLPQLKRAKGQVIFVNSSVVKSMGVGVAGYKASRHAMQGLADSLRQELNRQGIRATTVYPGQTATPNQRIIYAEQGKAYKPELLMSARDVAKVIVSLADLPKGVEITDLHLRSVTPY